MTMTILKELLNEFENIFYMWYDLEPIVVFEQLKIVLWETLNNIPSYTPLNFNIIFINLIGLITLLGCISFFLPKNPKIISILNSFSAFIIFIYVLTSPLQNFTFDKTPFFGVEFGPVIYLFIICSSIQLISFLLINNKINFTKDNLQIEYPLLIIFIFFSAIILIAASNWIIILLSLEAITFIVAVLVAFERHHYLTSSVAIRYILFSAIPSGILILGIIEFYIYFGTFNLFDIAKFQIFNSLNPIIISNYLYIENNIYFALKEIFTNNFQAFTEYIYASETSDLPYIEEVWYKDLFEKEFYYLRESVYSFTAFLDGLYYELRRAPFDDKIYLVPSDESNGINILKFIEVTDFTALDDGGVYLPEAAFHYMDLFASLEKIHSKLPIEQNLIETIIINKETTTNTVPLIITVALFMVVFNIFFKLTAAPFHFWAPLIYEGAPLGVTMFLSIFTKITMVFFLIKLMIVLFPLIDINWTNLFLFSGLLSIAIGIFGAISETRIKRFFVYSSMGHVGFMLLGLATGTLHGMVASVLYLIVYILSSFIGWLVLYSSVNKIIYLTQLKGLSFNNPILAFILALSVLSMSGIPPLAGFFVKFDILYELICAEHYGAAFIGLLLTVISFFYYLRIIKILYFEGNNTFKLQFKLWTNSVHASILVYFIFFLVGFTIYVNTPLYLIIQQFFL